LNAITDRASVAAAFDHPQVRVRWKINASI
jgi:hypothetical protein